MHINPIIEESSPTKWIGGFILVLGLSAIGTVVWLDSTGRIQLEAGRTLRSDKLEAIPDEAPGVMWQSLKTLLPDGSSLSDGVLTVRYESEIHTGGGTNELVEAQIVVPLADLDTLIYATSHSSSAKAQDLWSVNAFCGDLAPCIESSHSSPSRGDKREHTANTTLLNIRDEGDATQAVLWLSALVAAHGGTAQVAGSIHQLEREYRE